jgi:hypothetical protein
MVFGCVMYNTRWTLINLSSILQYSSGPAAIVEPLIWFEVWSYQVRVAFEHNGMTSAHSTMRGRL